MATLHMDANIQSTNGNNFYKTRAVVWQEDSGQIKAVYYHIGKTTTAEVWEGYTCISSDLGFAMAYLRGAGFNDIPTFESFESYAALLTEIDEQFLNERLLIGDEDDEEVEAPF